MSVKCSQEVEPLWMFQNFIRFGNIWRHKIKDMSKYDSLYLMLKVGFILQMF